MSLHVQSFASGSNGNALLIQSPHSRILIDAGIAASKLEQHLRAGGVEPSTVDALCLTHEHSDHTYGIAVFAGRHAIPIICNAATWRALGLPHLQHLEHPTATQLTFRDLLIESFATPHDAAEPVGYRIDHPDGSVGVLTDAGHWNDAMCAALAPADLLVLEANHCRERLAQCGYPQHLQRRIRGPRGHLSNTQAAELVLALTRHSDRARYVWLAHLSARANQPQLALTQVRVALAQAGVRLPVGVLPRGRPGPRHTIRRAQQLALF